MGFEESILFSSRQKKGILILSLGLLTLSFCWVGWKWLAEPSIPAKAVAVSLYEAPAFDNDSALRIDINMAGAADWASLPGIGATLSTRIIKYRDASGGFKRTEDVKAVYGLSLETWENIQPYLFVNPLSIPQFRSKKPRPKFAFSRKQFQEIDINQAEATEFAELPGIGKVLSERIIKFRQMKGGFAQASDLADVYNLPEETYKALEPYVVVGPYRPRVLAEAAPLAATPNMVTPASAATRGAPHHAKGPEVEDAPELLPVDLNLADTASLKRLPGIGTKTAYRIVKYRDLLGFYSTVDQLKSVYGLNDRNFARMSPYLYVGDVSQFPRQDLNTATSRSLTYLPVFDKIDASRFIQARKQKGFFKDWEEVAAIQHLTQEQLTTLQIYYHL